MNSIQYGVGAPITIFDLVSGLQGEVVDTAALADAMQQALVGGGSGLDWPGSVRTVSNNFAFYLDQAKRATTSADFDVIIANLNREVARIQSLVSAMTTANDIVTYNGFHQRAFDPAWIDKINVFATDRLPVDIQRAEAVKAALPGGPRPLPIYIPINPGNLPPTPPIGGGTPQTKMCPDGSEIPINAMCKTPPGATGAATSSATPWVVGGVVVAALGAGAWWYFKKYRPTHSMAENPYFMRPYLHESEGSSELAARIEKWLKDYKSDGHDMELMYDARVYTQEQWKARGEKYGNDAVVSITTEGPLYMVLNSEYGEAGWKIEEDFRNFLESLGGYHYELGYAWSVHIYK